jgi:hypothetical protein
MAKFVFERRNLGITGLCIDVAAMKMHLSDLSLKQGTG